MANPISDLNNTSKHLRAFVQFGGAAPNNKLLFGGVDTSNFMIGGVKVPDLGGVEAQYVHDPRRIGNYIPVAIMRKAPSLPSAELTLMERRGGIPRQWFPQNCRFNLYELVGRCKDLSLLDSGWEEYVDILPGCIVTDRDLGDRTPFDDDKALEAKFSLTLERPPYAVGPLAFGVTGSSLTLTATPVIDAVYGSNINCGGSCGPANDGSQYIYAVTNGAASAPPNLIYSLDGGNTWTSVAITPAANAENPSCIDIVGDKLVVVSKTAGSATQGGYYWAPLNTLTGQPGTFTKVTTGFIATTGKAPNDILVLSASEVYFAADGGVVYKATDITAGVTVVTNGAATTANLLRIHGTIECIVATGATATVIYSQSRGATWAASPTSPVTGSVKVQAIAVVGRNAWWVGTDSGRVFYTLDGGNSWVEKTFSGSSAGTVYDLIAPTPEVLYFSHSTATPTARVFASFNGGYSFTNIAPRINLSTVFNLANRLAAPYYAADGVAANNLFLSGTAANGTDGTALLGVAPVI